LEYGLTQKIFFFCHYQSPDLECTCHPQKMNVNQGRYNTLKPLNDISGHFKMTRVGKIWKLDALSPDEQIRLGRDREAFRSRRDLVSVNIHNSHLLLERQIMDLDYVDFPDEQRSDVFFEQMFYDLD